MLELLFTLFVSVYDSNTQQVTYKGIQDLSFTQCVEYSNRINKTRFPNYIATCIPQNEQLSH